MSSKASARVTLTAKMVIMVLGVVVVANLVIGGIAYRISSQNLTAIRQLLPTSEKNLTK